MCPTVLDAGDRNAHFFDWFQRIIGVGKHALYFSASVGITKCWRILFLTPALWDLLLFLQQKRYLGDEISLSFSFEQFSWLQFFFVFRERESCSSVFSIKHWFYFSRSVSNLVTFSFLSVGFSYHCPICLQCKPCGILRKMVLSPIYA